MNAATGPAGSRALCGGGVRYSSTVRVHAPRVPATKAALKRTTRAGPGSFPHGRAPSASARLARRPPPAARQRCVSAASPPTKTSSPTSKRSSQSTSTTCGPIAVKFGKRSGGSEANQLVICAITCSGASS